MASWSSCEFSSTSALRVIKRPIKCRLEERLTADEEDMELLNDYNDDCRTCTAGTVTATCPQVLQDQ